MKCCHWGSLGSVATESSDGLTSCVVVVSFLVEEVKADKWELNRSLTFYRTQIQNVLHFINVLETSLQFFFLLIKSKCFPHLVL